MKRLLEVRHKHRVKKLRGWRKKQFTTVKISKITNEGFSFHNEGQEFYISKKSYPWFLDATEQEIRDIVKVQAPDKPYDAEAVYRWNLLDINIPTEWIKNPETMPKFTGVYVRKQDRPDLFERSDWRFNK